MTKKKTTKKNLMLTKESFVDAIIAWNNARSHYSQIENLITPTSIFIFTKADCAWLKKHSESNYFHIYMGVYENKLTAVLVPLDCDEREMNLPAYVASDLVALNKEVVLIEKQIIEKTNEVVLSTDLQVQYKKMEIKVPFEYEPAISENTSVREILSWKNNCLDWFYSESQEQDENKIFRAFKVPLVDLVKTDGELNDTHCFFGFKYSPIYNNLFPALIFVEVNDSSDESRVKGTITSSAHNEIDDFARPCPPFNNEINSFQFL